MMNSDGDNPPVVRDFGQIAAFHLPEGWTEMPQEHSELGQRSYSRDFSPPDDSLAVLSVYFRGFSVSEGSALRFHLLLSGEPHALSPDEIDSIRQVLSKMGDEDAFEMRSISTAEIAGRRALIVDGEWKTTQTQFHGLMIEGGESGREIQEIFFEAPLAAFMRYLHEVVDSIRGIKWKELS